MNEEQPETTEAETEAEKEVRQGIPGLYDRQPWLSFAAALVTSIVFAMGFCGFIHMSFDWGYELIQAWRQQPSPYAVNQGFTAGMALLYVMTPLMVGYNLGLFQEWFGGTRRWKVTMAALPLLIAIADPYDYDFTLAYTAGVVFRVGLAFLIAVAGFKSACALCAWVRPRTRPLPVFASALIFIAPMSVISFLKMFDLVDSDFPWGVELALYIALVFAAAMVANARATVTTRRERLKIALIATFPCLGANLFNLAGNLISLALDSVNLGLKLGWRALLSAVLISAAYLVAVLLGGLFAPAPTKVAELRD